jgi:ADP-ribosylglycohydrolase
MPADFQDRIVGCILGGAVGDALGGPYEGRSGPVVIEPDAPWFLSDDTQLTLATCEAICDCDSISPESIAKNFACWYRQGRVTGTGASTLKALRDLAAGAHWALAGRKGDQGAGNGAAMRIAPLAFLLDPDSSTQRTTLRDICRITHHNDEAYIGAVAVVRAVRAVTFGSWQPGQSLLELVAVPLPMTMVRERLLELHQVDPATAVFNVSRRFGCSGFVAESVPLAIYAAQRIGGIGFVQLLHEVIEAGGDTDTNASIAGQIVGAWLGFAGLPAALCERLKEEEVLRVAQDFAALVSSGKLSDGG